MTTSRGSEAEGGLSPPTRDGLPEPSVTTDQERIADGGTPSVRPRAPIRGFSDRSLAFSPRYGAHLAIGGMPEQAPTAALGRQGAGKPEMCVLRMGVEAAPRFGESLSSVAGPAAGGVLGRSVACSALLIAPLNTIKHEER